MNGSGFFLEKYTMYVVFSSLHVILSSVVDISTHDSVSYTYVHSQVINV